MQDTRSGLALGAAILALAIPATAAAQGMTADDLMAMGTGSLRGEIDQRYADALALTQDAGVISADSNQYMWASQAKAQCGIAFGFLKSNTKDPVSIGKCVDAHMRMQMAPPPPPTLAVPDTLCSQPVAGIVFFDWDSAIPAAQASQTLDAVVGNFSGCSWSGLTVTGHTDRSGSDAYNDRLSVSRANAVAQMLSDMGLSSGQLDVSGRGESEPKVPTLDGERNPTNRRVEVTVQQ